MAIGCVLTRFFLAIGDHHYKENEDLPADEQMIIAKPDIRIETIGE